MSNLYGKQAIVAFLEGYLNSEFPISRSLRNRFNEAVTHLAQHDDFSDFNFNEQEVDEIFELIRFFEDHYRTLSTYDRPDYYRYATNFVESAFRADLKNDPCKIFEHDEFLSAETKSQFLEISQQFNFINDYWIDLIDKSSTVLVQKFVKKISKSEYDYIIKKLTRQASKNKQPVFLWVFTYYV
jgi:hypothetical protein